jgi:hypothetical protein
MSGAVPDNLEKLSYRDLADRLGISPDTALELAAAEMREMGTKAELERELAGVAVLKDQLRLAMARQRRSWWRRFVG